MGQTEEMSETINNGWRDTELTPAKFYLFLLRRWRLMLALFAAILMVSSVALWRWPDTYRAEMRVLVKRARTDGPVGAGANSITAGVSESEIASEIELFRNPSSLGEAVVRCGLDKEIHKYNNDPRARVALAARELNRWLSVKRITKTDLISIRYEDHDPVRAARVLKTLSDIYLVKHTAVRRDRGASKFFTVQTALYKKQLDRAQAALEKFRRRHEVSSLAAEKDAALRRSNELEKSLDDIDSQIGSSEDRTTTLRRQMKALPATIESQTQSARNQVLIEKLKSTLLDLENRRTDLLTKYDPHYRLVREVETKIKDTRRMLEQEQQARIVGRTHAVNPLRQSIEGDLLRTETLLAGLKAKRREAAAVLAKVRTERSNLERITASYEDLVRQVKLAENNYLLYDKKREESRLADAMDKVRILNVSIIDPPVPPAVPIDHHKAFLFVLAFLLAGLGSFGIAWSVDYAGPVLRATREEIRSEKSIWVRTSGARVQKQPGPVDAAGSASQRETRALVATPLLPAEDAFSSWRAASPGFDASTTAEYGSSGSAPGAPRAIGGPGDIEEIMSRDLVRRDRFGHIVDYLSVFRKVGEGVAIGLAPEISEEEAALAAAQLSYSLRHRNGLSVLLVDGGNSGRLARLFGTASAPGLPDLLLGPLGMENQCIHRTRFEDLWILPGGDRRLNGNVPPGRVDIFYKALANRSLNLIIHLPRNGCSQSLLMLYSVLDAVILDLTEEGSNRRTTEYLTRRVMEAKKRFSECRLTLVGRAKDWNEADKDALTVC